jgi:mannitol/fructose-specific phosphotransferase system IIA component
MDEVHKTALNQCHLELVKDLCIENEFLDELQKRNVFTSILLEEIQVL